VAVTNDELRALYEGCHQRLVSQLFAVTGDYAAAQDAVQEAFVRAINAHRRLESVNNPEAWLRRVALNVARSRWRRLRRLDVLLGIGRAAAPGVSQMPALSPDRVAVVQALRALPAGQREALALHHLADLSVAEVAAALGVPVGTVKARLSRGRARLAQLLADETDESTEVSHDRT
jgi:RNA polymerase sigma-70 factor (ECF subfamily)